MVTSNPLSGIHIYYRRWVLKSVCLALAGESFRREDSIDLDSLAGPGSDTTESCSLHIVTAGHRHDGVLVTVGYNATASTTVRANWRRLFGLGISLRSERPQSEKKSQ